MHVTHHTCTLRTAAACVLCVCVTSTSPAARARATQTSLRNVTRLFPARPPLDSSLAPEGPGALADTECL